MPSRKAFGLYHISPALSRGFGKVFAGLVGLFCGEQSRQRSGFRSFLCGRRVFGMEGGGGGGCSLLRKVSVTPAPCVSGSTCVRTGAAPVRGRAPAPRACTESDNYCRELSVALGAAVSPVPVLRPARKPPGTVQPSPTPKPLSEKFLGGLGASFKKPPTYSLRPLRPRHHARSTTVLRPWCLHRKNLYS